MPCLPSEAFSRHGEQAVCLPWKALTVDSENNIIVGNINKEMLEDAPGFDKDHWPVTSEDAWLTDVYEYYGDDR